MIDGSIPSFDHDVILSDAITQSALGGAEAENHRSVIEPEFKV